MSIVPIIGRTCQGGKVEVDCFLLMVFGDSPLMDDQILYQKLYSLFQKAQRILLITHRKPDGDAVGSTSSLFSYLTSAGKEVTAFCVSPVPDQYHFLPLADQFSTDSAAFRRSYDLVCVLDSGDLSHAGVEDLINEMPQKPYLINIDHHATNQGYGDLNIIFVNVSSAAEIIHQFYEANRIPIRPEMATGLLTGILTDTSNFINDATNATCIQAASNLLICGARLKDITSALVNNKTIPALHLWGRAFERLRENHELGIASTVITMDDLEEADEDAPDALEGLANFLAATVNIPVIMVLREMPDGYVKGSLRSSTRDVSKIACLLGGGGHKKASGFTVKGRVVERNGIWQVE